jgi:hypothetical protein
VQKVPQKPEDLRPSFSLIRIKKSVVFLLLFVIILGSSRVVNHFLGYPKLGKGHKSDFSGMVNCQKWRQTKN